MSRYVRLVRCRFSGLMASEGELSCGSAGFLIDLSAGFSHRFVVFLGGLLPGRGEQLPGRLQQGAQFGLGEVVVDRAALGPAGDQAGFLEFDQVGGDVGPGSIIRAGKPSKLIPARCLPMARDHTTDRPRRAVEGLAAPGNDRTKAAGLGPRAPLVGANGLSPLPAITSREHLDRRGRREHGRNRRKSCDRFPRPKSTRRSAGKPAPIVADM